MFPVVKQGVPKPQWPFELRPAQVSCGRVYEQTSDSESESEPEVKKKKIVAADDKPKKDTATSTAAAKKDKASSEQSPNGHKGSTGGKIERKADVKTSDASKFQSPVTGGHTGEGHKQMSSPTGNTLDTLKSPVPVCEEEDEKCLICGDVGTLMLCDFPACPRVYHKMCIVRVAHQAVDEDWATSDVNMRSGTGRVQGAAEGADEDDTWFCPLHNCLGCGALEQTSYSLRTLNPPAALLTQLKIGKFCLFGYLL